MPRKPLEITTETAVVRWAQERGILVTKMVGNPSLTGWPDRCFWLPGGRCAFIEFKRRGKTLGPLQRHMCKKLQLLGYSVLQGCVDAEKAKEWLRKNVQHPFYIVP